jgi:hypothetical protein
MNVFHPEYIRTYHPDLLKDHILSSRGSIAMTKYVEKKRLEKPSHGTLLGVSKKPISLKPLEFFVYSRAGAPK